MTTKAPSPVTPAAPGSIEKIAYGSVEGIPTVEPHDADRLGYNIWRWLTNRQDPLPLVVKNANARLLISDEEAVARITEKLRQGGITI